MAEQFSHLDEEGQVRMVDVSGKAVTSRVAVAEASLVLEPATRAKLFEGSLPKGDALGSARVAGIMAAKQTPQLIPLCHPLPIDGVSVDISETAVGARITATVTTTGKTGVEMEAMTAAAVAALALYDMVKSVEKGVSIEGVRLLSKSGGRSGDWQR
ncbi:MAG: cyclic pyranopterin monophosphate synthase MoaC [Acidimicrobiia bacterium]|nr:cyclic pyranopterin monophosphate synthase MoaC [Acidimicrobiia bacterium]